MKTSSSMHCRYWAATLQSWAFWLQVYYTCTKEKPGAVARAYVLALYAAGMSVTLEVRTGQDECRRAAWSNQRSEQVGAQDRAYPGAIFLVDA